MPTTECVRRDERGESIADGSEPLQHREDKPFLGTNLWTRVLTPEHIDLLSQYENLNVFRA
jgi:hypothetical protein